MSGKRVSETMTRMAQIMTPNDANILGNVFGGSILAMVDLTASATSQKFAGRICATASFDRVDFHHPVEVGNFVEMEGTISFVGRTSMEVTIDVYATNLTRGDRKHTNTARVTMVALDENSRPTAVPRLVCETRVLRKTNHRSDPWANDRPDKHRCRLLPLPGCKSPALRRS